MTRAIHLAEFDHPSTGLFCRRFWPDSWLSRVTLLPEKATCRLCIRARAARKGKRR